MEITLAPSFIQGAVSLDVKPDGIHLWRLPVQELPLFQSHCALSEKLREPAGIRLRFHSNSPFVELDIAWVEGDHFDRLFDLVVDGKRVASTSTGENTSTIRFENLSEDATQIQEIWMPTGGPLILRGLKVADGSEFSPVEDQRLRWVTYGSSITHCHGSFSPSHSWPAMAARAHNLDLTCLGVGGQCHLDSMMALMIRDLPADIITLKLGINIYGRGSLNERSFAPAVVGFVRILREKHPETPIGLITPIFGANRETETNAGDMTLENYREQLRRAYQALKAHGDNHIFLFEGTELLGESLAGLLPDNLHPNGEGYEHMGRQAAQNILPELLADLK